MKLSKYALYIFCATIISTVALSCRTDTAVDSGNDFAMAPIKKPQAKKEFEVLCHYMVWFKHSEKDGTMQYYHWKWNGKKRNNDPEKSTLGNLRDISSVFYPRIGVYDSGDPDVVDYHILTAKSAGIESFIVDWYGPGNNEDNNLKVLFDRAEKLDFKVAICYEEKTCFPPRNNIDKRQGAVDKAVEEFKYIEKEYFSRKNYWRKNDKPCVFVFKGYGDWSKNGKKFFSQNEWNEILTRTRKEIYLLTQNPSSEYRDIKAVFSWCNGRKYIDSYNQRCDDMLKKGKFDFYVSSANPGFNDTGVWGWGDGPRFQASLGLETYKYYWQSFAKSMSDCIQIVTWNDFEEGTVIEPTVSNGNLYIDYTENCVSYLKAKEPDNSDNSLPYNWFVLKKFTDKKYTTRLEEAKKLLACGKSQDAERILKNVQTESDTTIPLYIDINNEYEPPIIMTDEEIEAAKQMPLIQSDYNLARNATARASSLEDKAKPAGNVNDELLNTRWASKYKDNQWLELTFDEIINANKIMIIWETAYGKEYSIVISEDGKNWETVVDEKEGKPGLFVYDLPKTKSFKYLKINCIKRGTGWGFSIWELAVFGEDADPEKVKAKYALSELTWNNENVTVWTKNGFSLKSREYGNIETKKFFPYSENGRISFKVKKLGKVNYACYTMQVVMYNSAGQFIGYIEPIKRAKNTGLQTVDFSKFKDAFKKETKLIRFRIWLEGELGSFIEIPYFKYRKGRK